MNESITPDQPTGGIDPARPAESAEVKRWAERVEKARRHDEEARKQYARDRRYARGDSGFAVDANIIGTFIDILTSFLYARDPQVDVLPAKSAEPPDLDAIREAAALEVEHDPRIAQAAFEAQQASHMAEAVAGLQPGSVGQSAGAMAAEQMREQLITERFEALQQAYRKRQRDNKAFAETLELVISSLWRKARLKSRAKLMVRSGLTVGPGWLKASWQERTGRDPITRQKIGDLRDNIAKVGKLRADMDDESGEALDAKVREYQAQLAALESQAETVFARGFAVDFIEAEDITVAPGVPLTSYLDAPWIDHRIPMLVDDIAAEFELSRDELRKVRRYTPRKPETARAESPNAGIEIDAKDADGFTEGTGEVGEWGMVHETWDRDANTVRTWVEGLNRWVREPSAPAATSRFYGFFLYALGEVDGQRHPQSLVTRSAKLVDEYNRIGSAEREHRMRVKPKTLFLGGQLDGEATVKVVNAEVGEFVDVRTTNPNTDLRALFQPLQYPALDPALYDRGRIIAELERIWGVQEAIAGSITVAKTATEAQMQQSGMAARTGAQRDAMEDVLGELAHYTAEVAALALTDEDVRDICGPGAMWPTFKGVDDLARMVNVEIRAGSSGKPNTTAEREAWSALLPLLQASVQRIGMLRNSTPADVADAEEQIVRMTIERSGDRIDLESLLPQAGPAPLMLPPGAPPSEPSATEIPA